MMDQPIAVPNTPPRYPLTIYIYILSAISRCLVDNENSFKKGPCKFTLRLFHVSKKEITLRAYWMKGA